MRESGYYPPGAEFDPRAPYNQHEPDFWPEIENVCVCDEGYVEVEVTWTIDGRRDYDYEYDMPTVYLFKPGKIKDISDYEEIAEAVFDDEF